jgi:hypothetical protein
MKKLGLTLIIILVFQLNSFGQSNSSKNQIGWYHLLPECKTKVLIHYDKAEKNKNLTTDISYATDEILLMFDFKDNIGYGIDIDGRIVQVENIEKIKRIETAGRIVKITKEVNINLDKKLTPGNNVWLIGFNSVNNSAKILLGSGEIVEIPKDSYVDIKEYLNQIGGNSQFRPVIGH